MSLTNRPVADSTFLNLILKICLKLLYLWIKSILQNIFKSWHFWILLVNLGSNAKSSPIFFAKNELLDSKNNLLRNGWKEFLDKNRESGPVCTVKSTEILKSAFKNITHKMEVSLHLKECDSYLDNIN